MSDTQDNKIRPPYGPPRRNVPPPPMPASDEQMSEPQQGPMMPGAPMPPQQPRNWQERFMRTYGMGIYANQRDASPVPAWLIGKSVMFFFIAMAACLFVFGYVPGMDLILASCISVLLFFFGGISMSQKWGRVSEKSFVKNVFVAGFLIRMVWVLYCYFIFNQNHYGTTYGDGADVVWYMPFGQELAKWLAGDSQWSLSGIMRNYGGGIDDFGYPMWLGFVYFLTGGISDVFIPMVIKAAMTAYCAVSMYNVAKRHFGNNVARIAAIFVCLNPNMIYWCGNMFKEAEMVFLCCFAVDKLDKALSSGNKLTIGSLWPGLLAAMSLFFFRTALALVLFIAVMGHVVLASNRVISWGKKVLIGMLVVLTLAIAMGDSILHQAQGLLERAQSSNQEVNMEWRSRREGGNEFAKYAGAAVFAPLIFTIPFPTFNEANATQLLHIQLSGGSYIKNILSFFVIVVLLLMVLSGEWRRHVFFLGYTCGYLVVLVFSEFAQSGRFHMPIMPMLMVLAAYGIQAAKNNKRLKRGFTLVLIGEIFICLLWNWFKLAGRGLA